MELVITSYFSKAAGAELFTRATRGIKAANKWLFWLVLAVCVFSCRPDNSKWLAGKFSETHAVAANTVRDALLSKTGGGPLAGYRGNDIKLGKPEPGEWLYEHPEKGQNLLEYLETQPVSPNKEQNKIYLLPLGKFSKEQRNVIARTAEYIQLFFGLETVISTPVSDAVVPKKARRTGKNKAEQLLAPFILDSILKKQIPKDAIVVMAITEKDLYPEPSWNFVFGLARLKERIGVSSMFRYSEKVNGSLNYTLCLERLIKTASHEIGHMFSMKHCTFAVCVMNGSNGMEESDSRPNRLCSQCLEKLHRNLGINYKKRTGELAGFFLAQGMMPDHTRTLADLHSLEQKTEH